MDWKNCSTPDGIPTLNCIPVAFSNVLSWAFLFAGLTALAFIIIAGYKFITSAGDPKQVEAAKKTITLAIIGLLIVLLSYFILNLISYSTGVSCITMFGFTNCQ